MLTFVGVAPLNAQLPLYQTHIEYVRPGVTAARQDFSAARWVRTSFRSPPVQPVMLARSATLPLWASFVRLHAAVLLATLAPACWKQTGSEFAARRASSDGFWTRLLAATGSGGAGGGTTPPVASGLIVEVA